MYAYRVTFTYRMRDGIAGPEGTEYRLSVRPYAPRYFRTCDNACRRLEREGWRRVAATKGPCFVREHVCTGANPVVPSFPVWATVS